MNEFDKIKSINDLPPDFNIIEIIINAIKTNDIGKERIDEYINILEPIKFENTIPEDVKCKDINTYRIYKLIELLSEDLIESIEPTEDLTTPIEPTEDTTKTKKSITKRIIKAEYNLVMRNIIMTLINRYLYLKQLEYENTKNKKKTLPLSKQILQDTNFIYQPEFLERIKNPPEITNKSITMNTHNNAKKGQFIIIPKLMKNPGLSHMFGLFGRKINTLLKNNNLNLCVSKLRFNIKVRSAGYMYFTTENRSYILNKFYNIYHTISGEIVLHRNAIIDIDINISQIVDELKKCKHRYYFILGSQKSFNNNFYDKIVDSAHKISLLFDTEKKLIYFYDPMGNSSYFLVDTKINLLNGCVLVLDHLFNSKTTKFDYFKVNKYSIYNNDHINTNGIQSNEFRSKKIKNVELENIKNYAKKIKGDNVDWAGGYCGLWNLLLLSLLSINPNYNIHDILTFYNLLSEHDNTYGLVTKLIRSFAYHTEELLDGKIKSIPITRINISDIKAKAEQKLKLKLRGVDDGESLNNNSISIAEGSKEYNDAPQTKGKNIGLSPENNIPFTAHKKVMPFIKETIKAYRGNPLQFNNTKNTIIYKNSKKKKILFI